MEFLNRSVEKLKRKAMASSFIEGPDSKAPLLGANSLDVLDVSEVIRDTDFATSTLTFKSQQPPSSPANLTNQPPPAPINTPGPAQAKSAIDQVLHIVTAMQKSLHTVEDQVRLLTTNQQRIEAGVLENLKVTEEVRERVDKHDEQIMLLQEELQELKVRQPTLTPTTTTTHTTPSPVQPYKQIKGFIEADRLAEVGAKVRGEAKDKLKKEGTNQLAFLSDRDSPYPLSYSGVTHYPQDYQEGGIIKDLTLAAGEQLGCKFNNTQVIVYGPNGIIRFHGDDEPELVPGSPIASISLESTRVMQFKHLTTGEHCEVKLEAGDLTVINQTDQTSWHHAISLGAEPNGERVALICRMLRPLNNKPRVLVVGDSNCKGLNFVRTEAEPNKRILSGRVTGTNQYSPRLDTTPLVAEVGHYTDVIVQTGTNEIRQPDVSPSQHVKRVKEYASSILKVWPATKVHLTGIVPSRDPAVNQKILTVNHILREWVYSKDSSRLSFIDTAYFGDEAGLLRPHLSINNAHDSQPNFHLSQSGRSMMFNLFKEQIFRANNITLTGGGRRSQARGGPSYQADRRRDDNASSQGYQDDRRRDDSATRRGRSRGRSRGATRGVNRGTNRGGNSDWGSQPR